MLWTWLRRVLRRPLATSEALRQFRAERPRLEARFLAAAVASGKPRGLRWQRCDWEEGEVFVRDRDTAQLLALVGVTIAFEAVEGGDMEGVPAVGDLRHATAVFFLDSGAWHTTGKALFNLSPGEAVARFAGRYVAVDEV